LLYVVAETIFNNNWVWNWISKNSLGYSL